MGLMSFVSSRPFGSLSRNCGSGHFGAGHTDSAVPQPTGSDAGQTGAGQTESAVLPAASQPCPTPPTPPPPCGTKGTSRWATQLGPAPPWDSSLRSVTKGTSRWITRGLDRCTASIGDCARAGDGAGFQGREGSGLAPARGLGKIVVLKGCAAAPTSQVVPRPTPAPSSASPGPAPLLSASLPCTGPAPRVSPSGAHWYCPAATPRAAASPLA
mmetsp:Transcript_100984/g.231619  ORF Transcript_100984/g.231619 Transcript_100984/m.231619 type:complete len:213 (+) Transcript_100984:366-1004(+)